MWVESQSFFSVIFEFRYYTLQDWVQRKSMYEWSTVADVQWCIGNEHLKDNQIFHNVTFVLESGWGDSGRGINISFFQEPIDLTGNLVAQKTFVVTAEEIEYNQPFPSFDYEWADADFGSLPTAEDMDRFHEILLDEYSENYFEIYENSSRDDFSDFRQVFFFERESIQFHGQRMNDFIVQCSFDDQNCDRNKFKEYEDPKYGNCFTFNATRSDISSFLF